MVGWMDGRQAGRYFPFETQTKNSFALWILLSCWMWLIKTFIQHLSSFTLFIIENSTNTPFPNSCVSDKALGIHCSENSLCRLKAIIQTHFFCPLTHLYLSCVLKKNTLLLHRFLIFLHVCTGGFFFFYCTKDTCENMLTSQHAHYQFTTGASEQGSTP